MKCFRYFCWTFMLLFVTEMSSQIVPGIREINLNLLSGSVSHENDMTSSEEKDTSDNYLDSEETSTKIAAVSDNDIETDVKSAVVKKLFYVLQSDLLENTEFDDEVVEEPDIPEEVLDEKQIAAKKLFLEAQSLQNRTKRNDLEAYSLYLQASELGNLDARAEIAWAKLMGRVITQSVTEAKEMFDFLADKGHHQGHMGIGFMHATGIGLEFNQAKAVIYYTMAAAGGNKLAKFALAYRYESGINMKQNCNKALELYMEIGEEVISRVSFASGVVIHKTRLLDEFDNEAITSTADPNLISYYELMADKGDANAQVLLGQMYYQGTKGIDVDYVKSKHYFEMAAVNKNPIAMAYLGKLFLIDNEDLAHDYLMALYYFTMGADEKNPIALTGLGYMHLYGIGMNTNYAKALKYFQSAKNEKYPAAHLYLGLMYFDGLGVTKNYEIASHHFQRAALSGSVLAYFYLAKMYAYGLNSVRSCSKAVELLKGVAERDKMGSDLMKAYEEYHNDNLNEAYVQYALFSELGYEVGQSNLAFMTQYSSIPIFSHYNKSDVDKLTLMYWNRASMQGYSLARIQLGDCYYYGRGTHVDYETAASLYRMAAENHHNSQAMFNLGYMHENGIGLVRDVHLAKRYYDQAIEFNADASLPAGLALIKLHIVDFFSSFNVSDFMRHILDSNVDIYLLGTLIASSIFYYMLSRRR